MAKVTETITHMTDDLDGGEAAETVAFSLDGASYEIDLSDDNAARLRDDLAAYIGHARKVGRGGRGGRRAVANAPRKAASPGGSATGRTGEIRAWAKEQGLKVNERGRLSGDVVAAYEDAH